MSAGEIHLQFVVKHMVWLTLLLYLLSGFGSAFGAFWCLSGKDACGPGQPCAIRCLPHTGASATLTSAGSLLDVGRGGPCLDLEFWLPTLKSRVRPLRTPGGQLHFLSAIRPVLAALAPITPIFPPGLALSGPLLALRHLRTVVLLN
ncbi:MAG: hypothetical protein A2X84_01915 [Desulfuromonadaceae bacterium GWC2_58_13]|nr:MAG: hypothetical protein A2X84_01915 [Desulfuromonadaceae bacterium GWC2_58_13]